MRISVRINDAGVSLLEASLKLNSRLSERASTASFDIIGEDILDPPVCAIAPFPALGGWTRVYPRDEVEIDRASNPMISCAIALFPALGGNSTYLDNLFGGYIAIVDKQVKGAGLNSVPPPFRVYSCQAHDYNARLNSILIDETYSGLTEAEIIDDLFSNYWNEIDATTYVVGPEVVPDIVFQNIYLGDALDILAKMYNRVFKIDYDKNLHYLTDTVSEAPFELSDESDGISSILLPYNILSWREDAARLINRVLVIGDGVERTRTDADSYAQFGEYFDYVHENSAIDNEDWADLAGDAILAESAFEKISGRIQFWQEGLEVGQLVHIKNFRRDIDDNYRIQSVELIILGPDQEQVVIDVGDYSYNLADLLFRLRKLEKQVPGWSYDEATDEVVFQI